MELSAEDKAILAHIVVNPNEWVEHALKIVGEKAVIAKINKYRAEYLTQKDLPNYKTRAEREVLNNAY